MAKEKRKIRKLTKNKNVMNIDELNAYQVAYGDPLGYKDYFKFIGLPGLALAGLSFIIMYTWWFSLIMATIGGIYGVKVVLPKSVDKRYQSLSFTQRNMFLNNMTQILTDEGKTINQALDTVRRRATGEFKEDLDQLQARVLGANEKQIQEAIKFLTDKYEKDIIFIQYVEQLETAMIEGRTNIDTLKDIKNYHNDIKKKQQLYEREKDRRLNDLKNITIAMVGFVLAASLLLLGLDEYIRLFTSSWIGWITSLIFLFLQISFYSEFFTYYFDDSVTEISF